MNMYQSINQTNEFPVSSLNCFCVSCYPKTMTNYQHYSLYHTNVINKLIHLLTIPIIMITTAHFIQKFHIVFDDEELIKKNIKLSIHNSSSLLTLVQLFYCFYYFTWSWTIGFTMMFYIEAIIQGTYKLQSYLLNYYEKWYSKKIMIDLSILSIMCLAWGLQFLGHYIEDNRPALMDNLSTAFLSAPMFSLDFLFNSYLIPI